MWWTVLICLLILLRFISLSQCGQLAFTSGLFLLRAFANHRVICFGFLSRASAISSLRALLMYWFLSNSESRKSFSSRVKSLLHMVCIKISSYSNLYRNSFVWLSFRKFQVLRCSRPDDGALEGPWRLHSTKTLSRWDRLVKARFVSQERSTRT